MQQILITEKYDPTVIDAPLFKIPSKSGIKINRRMNAWLKVGGELQLKTVDIRSKPYSLKYKTTKGKPKAVKVVDVYCYELGIVPVPVNELRVLAGNVKVRGARSEKSW